MSSACCPTHVLSPLCGLKAYDGSDILPIFIAARGLRVKSKAAPTSFSSQNKCRAKLLLPQRQEQCGADFFLKQEQRPRCRAKDVARKSKLAHRADIHGSGVRRRMRKRVRAAVVGL
ncbi:hypothetical protein FOA52_013840 [Chlamydomonas sp. UWO 241]|nr:hypothetical protein FOA52_013840 [Chlamydomonas sp. UWO 241]